MKDMTVVYVFVLFLVIFSATFYRVGFIEGEKEVRAVSIDGVTFSGNADRKNATFLLGDNQFVSYMGSDKVVITKR